jgi:uncharacterized glyoxalase superfamily protein PhnB
MPDPFESLREPIAPLSPRPQFANNLRDRLAVALGIDAEPTEHKEVREYTPARLHSVTAYLACKGADRAIEWYQRVFAARLLDDPVIMPDGHVGHAELAVGDAVFMLADEFPEERHMGPDTLGGSSVALMIHVPDSDRTVRLALAEGAELLRPITEQYGARSGVIRDPFGHRWFVATAVEADDVPIEDVPGRRFGDLGYVTLEVPDGDRAERFFSQLFGWKTHGGYQPGSYHVESITPPSGIHGREGAPEVRLFFRVDDIETTAARVRELGGQVLTITQYDSGGNAECVDDQGLRFDLFRPRPGY